jgi:hypothetical protein
MSPAPRALFYQDYSCQLKDFIGRDMADVPKSLIGDSLKYRKLRSKPEWMITHQLDIPYAEEAQGCCF